MTDRKVVHVIGTGTIGEPLIAILVRYAQDLGIDEVTFHKRSPLLTDRSKVLALQRLGAKLAVDKERFPDFEGMEMQPVYNSEQALGQATVVIDCTPVGNRNKSDIYERYRNQVTGFIAQGSEHGFGKPYALDMNDRALVRGEDQFIQVVSCNTHNIAALIRAISLKDDDGDNLEEGRFLCIRRASDLSQEGSFIPSPKVGTHKVERFGTHHARDAHDLYATLGHDFNVFSSAMQVGTQYMHTIYFSLRLKESVTLQEVERRFREAKRVAVSYKEMASCVFSFGRDHGAYGRLLDHTVIPLSSLTVRDSGHEVVGFCYTPQDGNSLMSSLAATLWFLDSETYLSKLSIFDRFCFAEI